MQNIGVPGLILIIILALIIFGPSKLPELGRAVGSTFREFKKSVSSEKEEIKQALETPEVKKEAQVESTEQTDQTNQS